MSVSCWFFLNLALQKSILLWIRSHKEKGRNTSSHLFWPLGLSFHVGGIDRWLSEGPLSLFLSHVIQFRGLVEFIVSVYGRAEQSAIWLSGQTLWGPEKKGRAWHGAWGIVCVAFWDQFLDFKPIFFVFATFVKYWAHNCFILIAGTLKLNCLNFGLFIARAKINMYQLWLQ